MKVRNRHMRTSIADKTVDVFIYALLLVMSILFVYPLYQVAVASVSDPSVVMKQNGLLLFPGSIQFDAYKIVFSNGNIGRGFLNTLLYMVLGTAFQYVITVLTAFALSKKSAMLKKPLMIYMLITMYFSGGLIPYFLLINNLGLMNSRLVLILPYGVNVWNIIIMRTQFLNIPESLSEAAYMDGAKDYQVLLRVFVPLSGAVSAVLILFTAVMYWNMWFDPMIYLTERSKYPLQSILREILIDNNAQMMAGSGRVKVRVSTLNNDSFKTLVKYAIIMVGTVPILCIYPFLQKYFVKGVMVGSLKG